MSDDVRPPSMIDAFSAESVCRDTANGWLWYCDQHDTHGNADSQDEAEAAGDFHADWQLEHGWGERCEINVWQRTKHERL